MATRHKELVRSENGQSEAQATSPARDEIGNDGIDPSKHAERWYAANDEYLAAGLHWLRLLLAGEKAELPLALARLRVAEAAEPAPALIVLSHNLGLSRFERDTLLLCAAMELDTRIAGLCAQVQNDSAKPYPTFALALSLFDEPAWDIVSPDRPLRYWRLIEIHQPGTTPLTAAALRADERIVHYLKGLNTLDDRFAALLTPMNVNPVLRAAGRAGEHTLPPTQHAMAEEIVHELHRAVVAGRQPAVQLTGPHAASKRLIAEQVAATLGVQPYWLPAETLPANPAELETFARLWQRETQLLPLALVVDATEIDPVGPQTTALKRLLARSHGIFFLEVREVMAGLSEQLAAFEIGQPTATEQAEIWAGALGPLAGEAPAVLAAQFNLDPASILHAAETAQLDGTGPADVVDRLWRACRTESRPRLESLAQRLEPIATWDDLVLPADATALLHQITDQVRQRLHVYDTWGFRAKMNRGLGISALFAGDSGTGKTMAAEVLANDLRLDLYRIDLSAVVSKYIGETEKNLRRLFDAAEDGGAILFFDEADALFGKRSEVKDSHDRYANIEINYLLQRMEAYRGLAILATNMKSALDPAFMRRLRFSVTFPFPGLPERRLMWEKVFPPQAPVAGLDYDHLARLNLTGGLIHNIALSAAFMAAGEKPALISMPIVREAIRVEMRKLDRPINGI